MRFRGASVVALLVLGASAAGCTTRLTEPSAPSSPVSALLLDHGRHASLVLPGTDHGTVRYSFGDWRYYAKGDTRLRSGLKALFWPTPSALGRRELEAEPEEEAVRGALRVVAEAVLTFQVEEQRARALRTRLDSLFLEGREEAFHYNAGYDLEFVRHPATYWFGHNSNQVLAQWLRELGISVEGLTLTSSWEMEAPDAPADSGGRLRSRVDPEISAPCGSPGPPGRGQPLRMGRPGRGRDQIPVHVGPRNLDVLPVGPCRPGLGTARGEG